MHYNQIYNGSYHKLCEVKPNRRSTMEDIISIKVWSTLILFYNKINSSGEDFNWSTMNDLKFMEKAFKTFVATGST